MFQFINVNPENERIQDCVIRAISLALNIPYYEVVRLLSELGDIYECEEICMNCYRRLLDEMCIVHYKSKRARVKDVAEDFDNCILLIRTEGHLTCSLYGRIMDIWNCEEEVVTDFWVVDFRG